MKMLETVKKMALLAIILVLLGVSPGMARVAVSSQLEKPTPLQLYVK